MRPLKLAYTYNKAHILRAYIFAQTELNNFSKWFKPLDDQWWLDGGSQTASEYIEEVKEQLQDKDALGIYEVNVFVDLSKAETIKTIKSIKENSAEFAD